MYIAGIIEKREQKLLSIFAMPDHLHVLIALKPNIAISDLVCDIKAASSAFVNERGWIKGKFSWQEGFGCFSYSKSHVDKVIQYILNQQDHHKTKSFKDEYLDFLRKFEVPFEDKYLFEWLDEDSSLDHH